MPSAIEIQEGLGGSVLFQPVKLANGVDPDLPFRLTVEGDIAPWLSFVDETDRKTNVTEVYADETGVTVLLRVEIPENAPVGANEGLITAVLENAQSSDESPTPVGVGLAIPVRVNVTGDRVLAGELLSLNVENTEIGLPLRGTVVVQNAGNTTVVPEVTLEVIQGTTSVYRTTLTGSALFPAETDTFEAVWDTTNATEGDYRALMAVSFDGLEIGIQEDRFELLPAGTLRRQVLFTSLELTNEPVSGGLARLEATASNPGQAEVSAVLVGELLHNGEIAEQIRSLDYLVRPEGVAVVPITIDLQEDLAEYTFSGYFTYEGGETESKQVTFTVGAAGDEATAADLEEDSSNSILPWLIIGLLGLVIVALLVALVSRRARKSPSSAGTTAAEPMEAPAGESAR